MKDAQYSQLPQSSEWSLTKHTLLHWDSISFTYKNLQDAPVLNSVSFLDNFSFTAYNLTLFCIWNINMFFYTILHDDYINRGEKVHVSILKSVFFQGKQEHLVFSTYLYT